MTLAKVAELLVSAQSQLNEATGILFSLMAKQTTTNRILANAQNTKSLPTYNSLFEDVLRVVNEIGPTNFREVADHLIDDLGITQEQLQIVQPQNPEKPTFVYRVEWAMWYLSDSIATYPSRGGHLRLDKKTGLYDITMAGVTALKNGIDTDANRAIIKRVNANSLLRRTVKKAAKAQQAKQQKRKDFQVKTLKFPKLKVSA
jgi:restriction endonuclease Mrr